MKNKLPSFTPLAIMEQEIDPFIAAEASATLAYATAAIEKKAELDEEEEDESSFSHLVQMVDGPNGSQIALVDVKGRLTNRDNPYNKYYGMVSYNQIRAAVVKGINAGASAIMFDVDTPGGAVSGMSSLSGFIAELDIPTVSYTAATMASAGYFIGAASNHIMADNMAEVGSIGVVMTVMDYSAAMKAEGVAAHVFRSGSLKQVGNSMESLSAEGKAYLQSQVMTYADKFFDYTAKCRQTTRASLEASGVLTGRTFIGEQSLAAGLVDRICTFEEALDFSMYLATNYLDKQEALSQTQNLGKPNSNLFNLSGDSDMKKTFSTQALAALTAGVVVPDETPAVPVAENTEKETVAEVVVPVVEQTPEVEVLRAELEETKVALGVAKLALVGSEEALAAAQVLIAPVEALKEVVASQIESLRVAMSLSPVDVSALSAESVVTEFNSLAAMFTKSFPVGGVVPDATAQDTKKEVIATREDTRAINALGF